LRKDTYEHKRKTPICRRRCQREFARARSGGRHARRYHGTNACQGKHRCCRLLWAGAITGIIFASMPQYRNDENIRFHAYQSIFAHSVIMLSSGVLALLGGDYTHTLQPLLGLGSFGFWIFMMYKAYTGETVVLPLVGSLAQRQSGGSHDTTIQR